MRHHKFAVAAIAMAPLLLLMGCDPPDHSTVARPAQAVTLTGAQVPSLNGIAPNRLVAFRFVYGTWQQEPVQVDERAVLDLGKPRNMTTGKTATFYTDANTFTGADPNPALDADDEISFMTANAFGEARSIDDSQYNIHYTLGEPAHVVHGSGVKVKVGDPLVAGSAAWMYLFQSDGTLDPAAGQAPAANYVFNLLSGDYKTTYKLGSGQNPENSTVTAGSYVAHFSDRWIFDQLQLKAYGATSADLLDLQKFAFIGTCGRSEYTFREGGGGLIANKTGPVRAIRSLMGANSGTFTQRDYIMYGSRMDIVTYLRVHAVGGSQEWIDWSPAAAGMQYLSSTTPSPVVIDGSPDTVSTANPTWELVRGAQGSIVQTTSSATDIAGLQAATTHYYSDTLTPTATEETCTGDAFNYGASGNRVNLSFPNTDPTLGTFNSVTATRSMTFLPPVAAAADAATIGAQAVAPLTITITPFAP